MTDYRSTTVSYKARGAVVAALMLAAFTFNTAENLPVGLLPLMADDLGVSQPTVGLLVTGYALTVVVVSLPLAHLTRAIPRRPLLTVLLALLATASWATAWHAVSYGPLLAARAATALAQALYWAVMGPVAVGLYPPERRGRIMGLLSVGGSLATVLGVPTGTWLGSHTGWRAPFAVLGALALLSLITVAVLLPTTHPRESHSAYGVTPDRRRFLLVVTTTALSVTGVFTAFTYIATFLDEVSGFDTDATGPLLLAFGAAGLAGVAATGPLLDRFFQATLVVPISTQLTALLGLYAIGHHQVACVALLMLLGASVAPAFTASQSQVLHWAPARTESALAANSVAFNVGVAVGALLGGAVFTGFGVRGTFLAGGLLTAGALVALSRGVRSQESDRRRIEP
ncbi:MFS transporter [Streptomyces sp. NPDC054829]